VLPNPALFGFSAEFPGDHPAYDEFEEYLRIEFPKRHPGWEPRFGRASRYDPAADRYDYVFLLNGNVPEASSQADAETKVRQLLHELGEGLRSLRPKTEKAIPQPTTRVWRWHS
jgi:hypothetical protein